MSLISFFVHGKPFQSNVMLQPAYWVNSFFLSPMNRPNKLERYITPALKGFPVTNTLARRAHS
jgi:hypothetical protein